MISMGTKRLFCSSFHHVGSKMVDSKIIMNQVQEYNIYNKYMVISESFIWLYLLENCHHFEKNSKIILSIKIKK